MNAPLNSLALLLLLATLPGSLARAQLQVLPADGGPRCVFGGADRTITLRLHNPSNQPVGAHLRLRLYQASAATALPLGERPWKAVEVLPGQTVLESAVLAFPPVRAETAFVVKWLQGTNQVVGTTELLVYPTNLLQELKAFGGEAPLGVLDPQQVLKPLLQAAAVDYTDLENTELTNYAGKLAIIGPFQSPAQMHEGLPNRLKGLAQQGVAVVWLLPQLQPPPERRYALKPSFYTVTAGNGAVVVAQARLVANLAENPEAQLNLLELVRLALHPLPHSLPQLPPSS